MNKIVPIMSALCAFPLADTNAAEQGKSAEVKRLPAHNPEWTNVKSGDPATKVLQYTKSSEKMMHDTAMSVIRKIGR